MADIVIVGVDGSETAQRAAEAAARLAHGLGCRLYVLTAFEGAEVETIRVGSEEWRLSDAEHAEQVAADCAAKLHPLHDDITSGAVAGSPGDVLVQEAERVGARVIVVGNVRMQGIGRILGSVGNDVAHHAPCDVYIVKTT